jgi:hypothetical protein
MNNTNENLARLHALAVSGATNAEIKAVIGRPLTDDEEVVVSRARALSKLKKKNKSTEYPQADKLKAFRARERNIPYSTPPATVRAVRTRMEKDPEKWLRYYIAERFPLPFGKGHRRIIKSATRAMQRETSITVAAPRGEGKTSILWGMALYWTLTGRVRFPVVIGWTAEAGRELFDQWLDELALNERLREAYPCVCEPFAESTSGLRLRSLNRDVDTLQLVGADVEKGKGVITLPDTMEVDGRGRVIRRLPQAAMAGRSINGSVKGMNLRLLDGENIRPDIALLDDPQDVEAATSAAAVASVKKKLTSEYGPYPVRKRGSR